MLSIVPGTALAQESVWTEQAPVTAPPARGFPEMAYDVESDRIVLFGGSTADDSGFMDDTWAYDFNMNTWSDMNPGTRPSPRFAHAMAYDAESDRVILFGGTADSPETWAYDFNANSWTNRSPALQPTAWRFVDMAYDAKADRIVLFGGCDIGDLDSCFSPAFQRDETWVYDYNANTWTNRNPGTSPSGRLFYAMAYDAGSDRTILHSGEVITQHLGDTWAYDFNANSWTLMNPEGAPSRRESHGMAYDAQADRIVLFGGHYTTFIDGTWAYDFDDDTWIRTDNGVGPSPRGNLGLAYDTESDRMVLFGGITGSESPPWGIDETWAHQLVPSPPPPPWLVYIVIGVVAASVVAVVGIALTRRARRIREGEAGERAKGMRKGEGGE